MRVNSSIYDTSESTTLLKNVSLEAHYSWILIALLTLIAKEAKTAISV